MKIFKFTKLFLMSLGIFIILSASLLIYDFIFQDGSVYKIFFPNSSPSELINDIIFDYKYNDGSFGALCTMDIRSLCRKIDYKTWSGPSSCSDGSDASSKIATGFKECHDLTKEKCKEDNYCIIKFCSKFDNPMTCLAFNEEPLKSFKNTDEAIAFCEKTLKNGVNYGGECFGYVWEIYKDKFSNCENINNKVIRDYCYNSLAEKQKNYLICKKISENEKMDKCIYNIAIKNRDSNICQSLSDKTPYYDISSCSGSVYRVKLNDEAKKTGNSY